MPIGRLAHIAADSHAVERLAPSRLAMRNAPATLPATPTGRGEVQASHGSDGDPTRREPDATNACQN